MSKMILAANWKMNKTPEESSEYLNHFLNRISIQEEENFIFFPPTVNLVTAGDVLKGTKVGWGAQNCYFEEQGAFTGELSVKVLEQIKASHCLVGHSERRQLFSETDEIISKKVKAIQDHGLTPMLCVGETLEQKDQGFEVVKSQLEKGLSLASKDKPLLIAYEPVWAIGTGQVAGVNEVQSMHKNISSYLKASFKEVPILYGGSVKAENAADLFAVDFVDGFLVGGASLKPDTFLEIFKQV